jgi:IS4 transposase
LLQRQDFYGWSFIVRCQKNRTLDGVSVRKKIPQGYGEAIGNLKNGVRVKVIRHQGHFLMTNRKLMPRAVMQALYKLRWAIETTFKVLKSVLKLGSCQQSQMRAQAIFVGLVLVTHSVMALVGGPFSYNHLVFVNVGHLDPENSSLKTLFGEC